MNNELHCSYCKSDMKYGKDYTVTAVVWTVELEDKTHPLMEENVDRIICYRCSKKMTDWLAKAAGCRELENG